MSGEQQEHVSGLKIAVAEVQATCVQGSHLQCISFQLKPSWHGSKVVVPGIMGRRQTHEHELMSNTKLS